MELWAIFIIASVVAIILEMLIPSMFFLNFALAGVITAILSIFWGGFATLILVFLFLSLLSLIFVKPLLQKIMKKESGADFNASYIGKIVKVIEPVTKTSGAVTVYEERWEARIAQNAEGVEEIPSGSDVKIVSNDSLVLYVEKI